VSLNVGLRLGPYEILSPIGSGGVGEVYRARDSRLGRDVAVKVLPTSLARDPDRLARFGQEARAVAALNHPNIVAVYDVGVDHETPYVVAELLDGSSLRMRLEGGLLPVRKAITYAVQVAHGLAAAHEKGTVHRDLKPENLFVTVDGRVKILDFGLAKLVSRPILDQTAAPTTLPDTIPGTLLGTVGYMSPEQVRGDEVDYRSDLFSLGAIVYEMLSGRHPFRHAEGAVETMHAILRDEPRAMSDLRPGLPPALERIVAHCLEKDPRERFQSARDLAFHLEAVSGASDAAGGRATVGRSLRRWVPLGVTALLLALAIVGGVAVGRRSELPTPPEFERLTFQRGTIWSARFVPGDQTVVYSAAWNGTPQEVFSLRPGTPTARPLGYQPAEVLAVSTTGELVLALRRLSPHPFSRIGTLAYVPLGGGAPRELVEGVRDADWAPEGKQMAAVIAGVPERLEYPVGRVLYRTNTWISHARVSPDGQQVAFIDHRQPNEDAGDVAVVNARGEKTTLSAGWVTAQGLAWAPGGREVWFTASRTGNNRALHAVSLAGEERRLLSSGGTLTLMDIAPDGRVLLSVENVRSRVAAKPAGGDERDLSWLDYTGLASLSTDGRLAVLVESGDGGGPHYSIYLRSTDGSPAVRIGPGKRGEISPDGRSVLTVPRGDATQMSVLPVGAGAPRTISHPGLHYIIGGWLPNGGRLVFGARRRDGPVQLFTSEASGGDLKEITIPGGLVRAPAVSPDGQNAAVMNADGVTRIHALDGSAEPRAIPGVQPFEEVVRWALDGSIYVKAPGHVPAPVLRVDPRTGRRVEWRRLAPVDLAGVTNIGTLILTPDLSAYAYGYTQIISDLYVVRGIGDPR